MSQSGRLAELAAKLRQKKLRAAAAYKRGSPDPERKLKIDKLRRYDMLTDRYSLKPSKPNLSIYLLRNYKMINILNEPIKSYNIYKTHFT